MGRAQCQNANRSILGNDTPPFPGPQAFAGARTLDIPRTPKARKTSLPATPEPSRDLLLNELIHRIKNSLAIIASIASLEEEGLTDPAAIESIERLRNRVLATSLLYEKLGTTGFPGVISAKSYIEELVALLVESLAAKPEALDLCLDVDDLAFGPKDAGALGLIVNEAVTNSFKYGLGQKGGRIRIECKIKAKGLCRLRIGDNGPGFPEEFRKGQGGDFGFTLMRLQAEELGGTLKLEEGKGATLSVTFPLRAKAR